MLYKNTIIHKKNNYGQAHCFIQIERKSPSGGKTRHHDVSFYAQHPDHLAAAGILKEAKEDRACVDYEVFS